MSPKINALIERFNKELNLIEQEAIKGLEMTKTISEDFSNQNALIQMSAFFNNTIFFVNTQRIRIQIIIKELYFVDDVIGGKIRIFAKLLDDELDKILEVKKTIKNIISDLRILK